MVVIFGCIVDQCFIFQYNIIALYSSCLSKSVV